MKATQLSLLLSGRYEQIYVLSKVGNILIKGSFHNYVLFRAFVCCIFIVCVFVVNTVLVLAGGLCFACVK